MLSLCFVAESQRRRGRFGGKAQSDLSTRRRERAASLRGVDAGVPPAPLQPEDLDTWYQASRQAHASHLCAYGPEEQVVGRTFSDEVEAALADLPPDFRTAVLLADLEAYTYREIADLVDCPIGTVMSRLAQGRKLLRDMLREYARKYGFDRGISYAMSGGR